MKVVELRVKQAAESILENERLTAGLADDAALALNNWGLAWANNIATNSDGLDDSAAYEYIAPRLKATRRMMRYVNRWVRKRADMDPDEERNHLKKVFDLAQDARGSVVEPDDSQAAPQVALPLNEAYSLTGNAPQVIVDLRQLVESTMETSIDSRREDGEL